MKYIIDTSSLRAFVTYYLPFDNENSLKNFLCDKIRSGEIVVLDVVQNEAKRGAQGLVVNALEILKEREFIVDTSDIYPDSAFLSLVDNNFCIKTQRDKLKDDAAYQERKNQFLENDADSKIIMYCRSVKSSGGLFSDFMVITEESKSLNDGKLFKKIPMICDDLGFKCNNLAYLLKNEFSIQLSKHLL